MLGNGEQITGGVTATLPDGMTIGVWSLSPSGSGQDASGSGPTSTSAPDYSVMETALEQMVDQFMANQPSSADQAYGSLPGSSDGVAQDGGTNVFA